VASPATAIVLSRGLSGCGDLGLVEIDSKTPAA